YPLATDPAPMEIVPGLLDPISDPPIRSDSSWWAQNDQVILKHRQALSRLVQSNMLGPGNRQGSGVLMVGGGRYWPGIVVGVRMLRDTGSALPVQIWHRGSEEPVYPNSLADVFGVEFRDLTKISPSPRIHGGWEAKTLAMLACSWERILYLD